MARGADEVWAGYVPVAQEVEAGEGLEVVARCGSCGRGGRVADWGRLWLGAAGHGYLGIGEATEDRPQLEACVWGDPSLLERMRR